MGLFNLFKSKEEREKKIAEISDIIYYNCVLGCKERHTNVYYRDISDLEPEVKKGVFSKLLSWFHFNHGEYLEELDFIVNNKAKEHSNSKPINCLKRMTKKEYEFYEKYIHIDCDIDENDSEWSYLKNVPEDMEYMYNYCNYNDHYIVEHDDIGFEYHDSRYTEILGLSYNYVTYIIKSYTFLKLYIFMLWKFSI